ncbi:hypothetical protein V8E36_001944 [Tilletia maclaganii]
MEYCDVGTKIASHLARLAPRRGCPGPSFLQSDTHFSLLPSGSALDDRLPTKRSALIFPSRTLTSTHSRIDSTTGQMSHPGSRTRLLRPSIMRPLTLARLPVLGLDPPKGEGKIRRLFLSVDMDWREIARLTARRRNQQDCGVNEVKGKKKWALYELRDHQHQTYAQLDQKHRHTSSSLAHLRLGPDTRFNMTRAPLPSGNYLHPPASVNRSASAPPTTRSGRRASRGCVHQRRTGRLPRQHHQLYDGKADEFQIEKLKSDQRGERKC